MASLTCSLSNSPLVQPVVSLKTGHLFEKYLILKYISVYGKCPHTDVELTEKDLLDVRDADTTIQKGQQSIPSLVEKVSKEFDSLLLEAHYLKERLRQTREELANSLYQQDASIRVIARLKRERDEARTEMADLIEKIRLL